MSYYRLRDIKTPPFAYVVNKEDVVGICELCQMPFPDLKEPLEVEIFMTESPDWESRIKGKPLMAEDWLIGDETFKNQLEACLPGQFKTAPVSIVAWLNRRPETLTTEHGDHLQQQDPASHPPFFLFKPIHAISLDEGLIQNFPPIKCGTCGRAIPEIPIEFQRLPTLGGKLPLVAALEHFHLEGYDYLFHGDIVESLRKQFPQMILEELVNEPQMI